MKTIEAEPEAPDERAGGAIVMTDADWHRVQQATQLAAGFGDPRRLDLEMVRSLLRLISRQRQRIRLLQKVERVRQQLKQAQPPLRTAAEMFHQQQLQVFGPSERRQTHDPR